MGRPRRNVPTGETIHIFNRTAHHERIFTTTRRKRIAAETYREAQDKFDFKLHSFIIMDNHVHVVITTTNDSQPISKIMHWINMMIARRMNKEIDRKGPFWNERFKSVKVYFFPVLNIYIGYNPVRKKLADYPGNYDYSSFLSYFNQNFDFCLKITLHEHFFTLGNTFDECVEKYCELEEWYLERNPQLKIH